MKLPRPHRKPRRPHRPIHPHEDTICVFVPSKRSPAYAKRIADFFETTVMDLIEAA